MGTADIDQGDFGLATFTEAAPEPEVSDPAPSLTPEMQALRAYARQLEEFSGALHNQVSTLVRMIEKTGS